MSDTGVQGRLVVEIEFFPSEERKTVELNWGATGIELLGALGKHLDSHILTKKGIPIPIDQRLEDGDRIRILSVASGG